MTNRSVTDSPLRDLATIWQRFTSWLQNIQGGKAIHSVELSRALSLMIAERWVELRAADGEGSQHRLARREASFFVSNVLQVLAARERRTIIVSDEFNVVVDAEAVHIPRTFLQKLSYRFIPAEHVILSFDCSTFKFWTTIDRAKFEAAIREASAVLSAPSPAA